MAVDAGSPAYAPFTKMATSSDTPNPLRPYYVPQPIGLPPPAPAANATQASSRSIPPQPSNTNLGRSARDILSDLDYGDYLSETSPSVAEMAKKLMDQAIWNYTSVLLAQPFEVAKTILQVHLGSDQSKTPARPQHADHSRRRSENYKYSEYLSDEEESESDSPSYFTSAAPRHTPSSSINSPSHRTRRTPSRSDSSTPTPPSPDAFYKLELRKSDSLLEVLSQLRAKEGSLGWWKSTNATFVYNVLLKTIESWTRSLLAALLNLPDPGLLGSVGPGSGGLDIVDSPNPIASLGVAVAAAGVAGLVLAPLDLIRTRLILTPSSASPRAILPNLRSLPSLAPPPQLLPIMLLNSTIPTLVSASAPLLLRSTLRIDPINTPATYSIATFLSSSLELFVKLPLETVLRRGQIATLSHHSQEKQRNKQWNNLRSQSSSASRGRKGRPISKSPEDTDDTLTTVVEPGPYRGIVGSMWFIVREEGTTQAPLASVKTAPGRMEAKVKKGQGVHGLWRGWRVGFWGLVGVWGAAAFNSSGGGEF